MFSTLIHQQWVLSFRITIWRRTKPVWFIPLNQGGGCPECEQPLDACSCNPSANPKDGLKTVRVSLSNKGRKGKSVTLIKGLRMNPSELKAYAGKLKKKTGTGGSLKDGVVEIQGGLQGEGGGDPEKGWLGGSMEFLRKKS